MFTNNYLVASFPLFHKVLVKTQVFTPANIVIQSFTLESLYYKGRYTNVIQIFLRFFVIFDTNLILFWLFYGRTYGLS